MTTGATLVHLLGAADLGLQRGGMREALQALVTQPEAVQDAALTGSSRAEQGTPRRVDHLEHHAAYRPLASALYELAAADIEAVDTLVLVATEQPEAHPDDTAGFADLLRQRIAANDGDLFGIISTGEVLVLIASSPTLDDIRTAVRVGLEQHPTPEGPVAVTLAGGATGAFLGAVLGSLEAGRLPTIVESNRQDGDPTAPRLHPLTVDHDTLTWAAASGNIPTLRALTQPPDRAVTEALFAVHQLDWTRLTHTELAGTAPWSTISIGRPPTDPAAWERQRDAVEAAITWRLARRDRSVLNLLRPWIEVEYGRRRAIAVRAHDSSDPLELEARAWYQQPPSHLDTAPEVIRSYLQDPDVRWCWTKGRSADHGGQPDPDLMGTAERWMRLASETNPYLKVQKDLAGAATTTAGNGVLAVQTVGLRDVTDDRTPMLDAVLTTYPSDRLHLRLVATEQTAATAQRLAAKALDHGVDVQVFAATNPYSFIAVRDDVLAMLHADPAWASTDHAVLLTGPGTKAMSIGAMAALLTTAFNHARPIEIASLTRSADGGTDLVASDQRIAARLAHDDAVEQAAPLLLRHIDLTGLERLLSAGSNRWDRLSLSVQSYRHALFSPQVREADLRAIGIEKAPDMPIPDQLCRARVRCLSQLVDTDIWRAIYLIATVAEQSVGSWHDASHPAGEALWRLRNASPYGHDSWATPPSRRDASRLIDELIDELPEGVHERALLLVHAQIEERLRAA